ncbi:cyclic nucleotide-binding domain-containing protein [Rhizobiaceae bacterium BDR2-2]|uniref:Cyclic nucleotide-binding domain-containing protein n=1 Tax=Ectorhizobium quercum TaxID=2965071 RepID=A0AAE3N434_9HYPH|nr:cyclic nucleotide-binding domain-containing protein [Ectorhizobium quercum]MCX8999299.1 cyclic nucleotide-binding domain-containing protein [Ectorhizobium quercum]
MALADDIRVLSQAPVFSSLPDDALRLVAFGAEKKVLSGGQVLFREGAPAESAYIVVSGRVAIVTGGRGEPQGFAGPGTLLSELALITRVERKFTAVAEGDLEVLRIARALFRRLMEEYPQVAVIAEARIRENITRLAAEAGAMQPRFG